MSEPTQSRLRVLVVCDLIAPGGGPTGYTYNLRAALSHLDVTDVEVEFAGIVVEQRNRATGDAPREPARRERRPTSVRRAVGRVRHDIGHALKNGITPRLREQIRAADLVIFQGYQDPRRLRYARRVGTATCYMPHSPTIAADEYAMMNPARSGAAVMRMRRRMIAAERALFRRADLVVFPTPHAAGAYADAFGEIIARKPVRYVLSGAPRPGATDSAGDAGAPDPGILFVGRYVSHKGYDLFLSVAETLKAQDPTLRFSTLGAGPARRESWAVDDLGWRDDPMPVIARARFLAIPNRIAYFDLLPLEAAALGKGLVFTAVGGNIDQHTMLPDSVICDVDDLAGGIAAGIERSADPDWGRANEDAFAQTFTAERMAERWLTLIRDWGAERRAETATGPAVDADAAPARALWLVPVADLGGVARHVLDVARGGIPGWSIVVLCPEGALAERLRAQGTAVTTGPFGPEAGARASWRTLQRTAAALRPAIVHSHLAYADIISAATPLPAGTRRFTTEHGIAGNDAVYHRSSLQARAMATVHRLRFPRFAGVIAVARATREAMIEKWHVTQPITVIPNGVDLPAGTERRDPGSVTGVRILALSRLAAEKRIDRLIEAFALVRAAHPTATLTIAGEGPLREELQALAARLDVEVAFPGFMDPEVAMDDADVVAQLSVWENCSYTLLDAAARGLRVVASDVGGNSDIIAAGQLVDPDDLPAVAAALIGTAAVPVDPPTSVGEMTAAIASAYATATAARREPGC